MEEEAMEIDDSDVICVIDPDGENMYLPKELFDDNCDEYILVTPENETQIQFEEGVVNKNLDLKVHFDLEFGQTCAMTPAEKYIVFIEWEDEDLFIYLGRQTLHSISGMTTVILTNRKTGNKTIAQLVSSLGLNHFILPLRFKEMKSLFSHNVYVELVFDRDDEMINRKYITTFFHGGMLQMEEEALLNMGAGPIDPIRNECHPVTVQNVFDYYELEKIKRMCRGGFTGPIIAALHKLSDKYDVRILNENQESILAAPLTVLEFLMVSEVYGLDTVRERTMARLTRQSEIKILSKYVKYLGPKTIKQLLRMFKSLNVNGLPVLPRCLIAPPTESEIMKTVLFNWNPIPSMKMPELQSLVDEHWTPTELHYTFEISSDDAYVVLKQVEPEGEQPARPPTVAACRLTPRYFGDSSVLRKSEFDVHVERNENIRFLIEYGSKRESTLWHIRCLITLCLKRADNTKLWEYTTNHNFQWNSPVCTVNALTEENLKKNYDGKVQFAVMIKVYESEGFVKVDAGSPQAGFIGTTYFHTNEATGNYRIPVNHKRLTLQSTVLKTLAEKAFTENLENHTRNVNLPGINGRCLEIILNHWDTIRELDLCDPKYKDIPVLARILQHKGAMDAVCDNMMRYNSTDRFRISEVFTYDDVQALCCQRIQSIHDIVRINFEKLEERSAIAVFAALKNL